VRESGDVVLILLLLVLSSIALPIGRLFGLGLFACSCRVQAGAAAFYGANQSLRGYPEEE